MPDRKRGGVPRPIGMAAYVPGKAAARKRRQAASTPSGWEKTATVSYTHLANTRPTRFTEAAPFPPNFPL